MNGQIGIIQSTDKPFTDTDPINQNILIRSLKWPLAWIPKVAPLVRHPSDEIVSSVMFCLLD